MRGSWVKFEVKIVKILWPQCVLHILWTTSFTSTSNRWLCQWTPTEVDFLKQTRTDPSPNFSCICLERCWRITSCRKTRAQCFYVIVLAKPVGIYVISFAIKFLKFKIGSTNIDGHSTKAVFLLFREPCGRKVKTHALKPDTVFWWVSIG